MRLYRKWIWAFFLLTVLSMTGCAALQKQVDNYDSCLSDPACVQKMQEVSTATTGVAGIVEGAFASPMSIPITALITLISTLLAGVYFGSKKQKPKVP